MDKRLKEKIDSLPETCGVYIMKSEENEILYIGKAISLKSRVKSYFTHSLLNVKTEILVDKIRDIDFIVCDTEAHALIMEAFLIKKYKPKYNIALRDDKSYPYIAVTDEDFPRIFPIRPKEKNAFLLFGPYPNVRLIKEALKLIRKVFPYRSCRVLPKSPCLYYHLKLCPAPCAKKISIAKYRDIIDNICKILKGERQSLINKLERRMQRASRNRQFEEAARLRDKLVALHSLYSGKKELHEILVLKDILGLKTVPLNIEAVDISNLKGTNATGSVVVFKDGYPDKSGYRRFRIKEVSQIDDYGMIREVIRRRYGRLKKEKLSLPQLVIIDGGLGQVNAAFRVLKELGLDITLVGIAKRNEELWLPFAKEPLVIPRDSLALKLIQRIRDEAHRFAHKYHSFLRKKSIVKE